MKYKGVIDKVFYNNGNWSSIRVKLNNGKSINCSGKIVSPIVGYDIEMNGDIIDDPVYGQQLKISDSKVKKSSKKAGIIAYLASGLIKGVGESYAKKIVDHFKENTLFVIENEPEKLKEIPGISNKKMTDIYESHKKNNIFCSLYEFLGGKITVYQASKIIEKYGDESLKKIKVNPYILIYEIDGVGFKKADAIAKASGISEYNIDRVSSGVIYLLKELSETNGHCYAPADLIQEKALDLLVSSPEFLNEKIIKDIYNDNGLWKTSKKEFLKKFKLFDFHLEKIENWLIARDNMVHKVAEALYILRDKSQIIIEGSDIYWKKLYDAEVNIAKIVTDLCNRNPIKDIPEKKLEKAIEYIEKSEGYSLEDEQKQAAKESVKNRLTVITGGPGRGKSTIIKTIIKMWDDDNSVILCAPTGKAAQRMREITGLKAETIHRAKINPTPYNCLVVVDEVSMVDIILANEFLEWAKYCNIVLVGDADQLQSIGPGSFFLSLINSHIVPTVKLVKGHRNFGSIAKNSELINNGMTMKDYIFNDFFHFIPCEDNLIQDAIIKEYMNMVSKYGVKNVCILAPMRARTNSAVNTLNTVIRDIVNPYKSHSPKLPGCKFREGDRVMQTKNMYNKYSIDSKGEIKLGVFNGDCGIVSKIDEDENTLEVYFDDDRTVVYDRHEVDELVLAYAMTIHKSQGSEYEGVIVVHSKGHYIMLRRELLYTAVTRAKTEITLIGDKSAFNNAALNTVAQMLGENVRYTKLKERIES